MNLVALMAGTLVLSALIYVIGAMASTGKSSPRNPLLRAPGGEHRGQPMPPTWHCEHSWEIAQKIAGPYFRRQAVTLVAACALVAGLSALGVTAKMSYPVIVILFVVTSYITFSIGGGQRGFQLSKLRCDHFDGSAVEPSTVPSRGQRLTHPAKSSGRASGRPMTA